MLTNLYTTKPCLMNGHRDLLEDGLMKGNSTYQAFGRSMRTCDLQLWNVTGDFGSAAVAHPPALLPLTVAALLAFLVLLAA